MLVWRINAALTLEPAGRNGGIDVADDKHSWKPMSRRDALGVAAAALAAAMVHGCGMRRTAETGQNRPSAPPDRSAPETQGVEAMSSGEWDVSFCGLNCARCKILLEKKECQGCRGPLDKNWSGDCPFRPCAQEKGHDYCFECADFPCEKLDAFACDGYEHHRLAAEHLKRMKEIGLEAWLAEQPKVMFCPGWYF